MRLEPAIIHCHTFLCDWSAAQGSSWKPTSSVLPRTFHVGELTKPLGVFLSVVFQNFIVVSFCPSLRFSAAAFLHRQRPKTFPDCDGKGKDTQAHWPMLQNPRRTGAASSHTKDQACEIIAQLLKFHRGHSATLFKNIFCGIKNTSHIAYPLSTYIIFLF